MVGLIKGKQRYNRRYKYSYFDARPMNHVKKYFHNFKRVVFLSTTFYVSIVLTCLELLTFQFLKGY